MYRLGSIVWCLTAFCLTNEHTLFDRLAEKVHRAFIFLLRCGLKWRHAEALVKRYRDKAEQEVRRDPYTSLLALSGASWADAEAVGF